MADPSGTTPRRDEAGVAPLRHALTYPFATAPAIGAVAEVAPGVLWLRMPIPLALDHINLYLVAAGKRWVLVDTGPGSGEAAAVWDRLFAGPLAGVSLAAVACTHFHADHSGLSRMLCERFDAPLLMTPGEFCWRLAWPATVTEMPPEHAAFYREAGYPTHLAADATQLFAMPGLLGPMRMSFRRLREHDRLAFADEDWRVLIGHGHSPEHAMLYCSGRSLLISGDQLLPKISSNVSVMAIDPDAEPLGPWLASLERLGELPEDTLVLPAHGLPFRGIRPRVKQLQDHHALTLRKAAAACEGVPRTAYEVSTRLFPGPLQGLAHVLALGEAIAHLQHLVRSGELASTVDAAGVRRFEAAPAHPSHPRADRATHF